MEKAKGFVAQNSHLFIWIVSVGALFGALWVQVNFPSRREFREVTKEMLDKIDAIVRLANESGMQLAIVKERQDLNSIRIIDVDKRLNTLEIRFHGRIPDPLNQ